MADLFLVASPSSKSEMSMTARIDMIIRLVNSAENFLKQPVHDVDGIKALIAQMDEVGLKHWAKELRKLLE